MSIENTEKKDDEPVNHYLIKLDLTDYSNSIYKFPISDPGSHLNPDHTFNIYFKAIFYPESGFFSDKINILMSASNIDLEGNEKNFTIHYKISKGEIIKLREYEDMTVEGYLPEDKLFYGLLHKKFDSSLFKNRYAYQSGDSDLAFFYTDDESIKIAKQLWYPGNQEIDKVIKLGDNFLLIGASQTPLKWRFNNLEVDRILEDFLEETSIYSNDALILLLNKKLYYLDSKIYPQRNNDSYINFRINSPIKSISKINERHFMLFKDSQKIEISVNKIKEFN